MYKVITSFVDLQDNNHRYHVGDIFPHNGIEVSEERLEELSTDKNRRHKPMIEKVRERKPEVKKEEPVVTEDATAEVVTEETKSTPRRNGRKKADAE